MRSDDLTLSRSQEQMAKKDGMVDWHASLHEHAAGQVSGSRPFLHNVTVPG